MEFHAGRMVVWRPGRSNPRTGERAVGAEPPDRHPLGRAGRGGGFRRTFQALGLGAVGQVRWRAPARRRSGCGSRARFAASRRPKCAARRPRCARPAGRRGRRRSAPTMIDMISAARPLSVTKPTKSVSGTTIRTTQSRPVSTAHRLGRDDDALVAEIEDLAAIAFDPQPVVGARQHGIAQLIEHAAPATSGLSAGNQLSLG